MKPGLSARVKKLRKTMAERGLDAILTSSAEDVFYYTGYRGLEEDKGFLVIPRKGKPSIIVSPLEQEARNFYPRVVIMDEIKDFLRVLEPFEKVGYDEKNLSVLLFREIEKAGPDPVPAGELFECNRMIKDEHEISEIRKAIRITGKVFNRLSGHIRGKKEMEVARLAEIEFRKLGVTESFESIVSSGKLSAFVHHKPGAKVIGEGDPVIVDIGCRHNMYCSDLTRMFLDRMTGKKEKNIYEDLKEIRSTLIGSMRAGVKVEDIADLQERLFKNKGHEPVHGFGHGVGLSVHEPLGEWLKENMVITCEPGIYVDNVGGFRIEDMLLIKKGKAEILSGSIPVE